MKLYKFILLFILSLSGVYAQNAPPFVTYAGQVASGGQPFNGTGQFKFAFVNADANVTYWSHDGTSTAGSEPTAYISVPVNGGYYSILLGNTAMSGMGAINPAIFKTYSDIHLRVWFTDGVAAFEEMAPHRPFASVPYALNAGVADGSISSAKLESTILTYLKPEVSGPPKAVRSLADFQKKITLESGATGKYLTYQWKKNGSALPGETNATLVISEANATHDGNYSVSVTNNFGSVESAQIDLQTNTHRVASAANLEMLWVPEGNFTMGSPTTETGRNTNETEHNVSLSQGFYLGKYEVTQAQYAVVMSGNANSLNASPSNWPNNPNRPVEQVSWADVQIFLSRLNASEQAAGRLPSGWSYVLPTESQWEYACRAGTTTAYSRGTTIATSNANYDFAIGQTTDVGQYAANPWGFFDMHGNVYEWTADWYAATYPTGNPVIDPTGAASGSTRVFRGGSWNIPGTTLRSAHRFGNTPSARGNFIGFRVGFKQVKPDTASPELVLSGGAVVTHVAGQAWAEPGVAAHDVRDGNLSGRVSVSGLVDVNTTGLYVLTYTVSDTAGNLATANRKVRVTPPAPTTATYLVPTAANLEMIWVADGNFTMGSPTTETGRGTNETEHNVSLTRGFYLGKYEVTQTQYAVVMSGNTNSLNLSPSNFKFNSLIKGTYSGGAFDQGSYVFSDGAWLQAVSAASATDIPSNPANLNSISATPMTAGDAIHALGSTVVRVANSNMKGTFDPNKAYAVGDVVYGGVDGAGQGKYAALASAHLGTWASGTAVGATDTVYKDGIIYAPAAGAITAANNTAANFSAANWTALTTGGPPSTDDLVVGAATDVSATVYISGKDTTNTNNIYFSNSPWQLGNPFAAADSSNWPNNPNRPVEKVSWDDVQIFLTRLNASEQAAGRLPNGWSYVLPTESQWEYACRAGTTTAYSGGATITTSNANYNSTIGQTTDVGQYAANPWGFFDMHGNVYEWTADWYGATYPTGNPVVDPAGEASGSGRVVRGGSWFNAGAYLRSAFRSNDLPSLRRSDIGFRVGFQQQ